MENKIIIGALIVLIILLLLVLGVMFLQTNSKEPTTIEIKQTNLTVDDNIFSVNVTDSKGNLLPDVKVNLTIEDNNGEVIVDEDVPLYPDETSIFDFDLEKGKYVVTVSYDGNENYSGSDATYKLNIDKVTPTYADEELLAMEYPQESPVFGHYRVIERQYELVLIETSNGELYVLAGDGYHTYGGHDSQGNIQLGTFVGDY